MLLTWQRRDGGVRSEERGGECVKELGGSARGSEGRGAGGRAARWRGVGRSAMAGSRPQRGSGGRRGGSQPKRRVRFF